MPYLEIGDMHHILMLIIYARYSINGNAPCF